MIDLKNDNCLELMSKMSDSSIDLIVTDPPYKVTSRGCSGTMGGYWKEKRQNKGLSLIAIIHLVKNIYLSSIES